MGKNKEFYYNQTKDDDELSPTKPASLEEGFWSNLAAAGAISSAFLQQVSSHVSMKLGTRTRRAFHSNAHIVSGQAAAAAARERQIRREHDIFDAEFRALTENHDPFAMPMYKTEL